MDEHLYFMVLDHCLFLVFLSTFQYPLVKKMAFLLSSDFRSRLCMHFQITTNIELAWVGFIWSLLQHINTYWVI